MGRLLYFTRKALESIAESPGISALTSGSIAAALVVVGGFVVGLHNLEELAHLWGRNARVEAIIADGVPMSHWDGIRGAVASQPGVLGAELMTPEQALEQLRARGPETAALVEGVEPAALPASVLVRLGPGMETPSALEALAAELGHIEGVAEVDYGREELERLRNLLEVLRAFGIAVGLAIGLAAALIVSNTIRLTVFARRDEIAIQKLVGGTDAFVRLPFLLEGGVWGVLGGSIAALVLFTAHLALAGRLSASLADTLGGIELSLATPEVLVSLPLVGLGLGILGSALAVRRFLEVDTP